MYRLIAITSSTFFNKHHKYVYQLRLKRQVKNTFIRNFSLNLDKRYLDIVAEVIIKMNYFFPFQTKATFQGFVHLILF